MLIVRGPRRLRTSPFFGEGSALRFWESETLSPRRCERTLPGLVSTESCACFNQKDDVTSSKRKRGVRGISHRPNALRFCALPFSGHPNIHRTSLAAPSSELRGFAFFVFSRLLDLPSAAVSGGCIVFSGTRYVPPVKRGPGVTSSVCAVLARARHAGLASLLQGGSREGGSLEPFS